MRLFNAIVFDVWKDRQNDVEKLRRNVENVVRQKRERLDRIDEAFVHECSIDRQTHERQRDQLREQLALAEIELNDAVLDQLDIEGVLAFAEHA
jgi:ribosomal protein L20